MGLAAAASGNRALFAIAEGSAPFGKIFNNAIRMIVIPLVVPIIFASIARLGDTKTPGKIGGKTLGFTGSPSFRRFFWAWALWHWGFTFLVSLTVAPVPPSGAIIMAPALEAIGAPVAGLALILGVDRIPDMMRSSVNVMGQAATAIVLDEDRPQDWPKD